MATWVSYNHNHSRRRNAAYLVVVISAGKGLPVHAPIPAPPPRMMTHSRQGLRVWDCINNGSKQKARPKGVNLKVH